MRGWMGCRLGRAAALAVHSYFPAGRRVRVPSRPGGRIRASRTSSKSPWMASGSGLIAIGGGGGRGGRGGGAPTANSVLPVKAGPQLVGVAFVQHTEARDEGTLRPRQRSRGTQPAIASVTISGPYNATGPGDTPSRRDLRLPSADCGGRSALARSRFFRR